MTREDIEKAAGKYSGSVLGFLKNPYVMNDHRVFVDGAYWRINSVWHNDLKIGEPKKPILVRFKNGLFQLFEDIRELKGIESEVEMFAYLEDLTPNTEDR